jgi:hypothetical protein
MNKAVVQICALCLLVLNTVEAAYYDHFGFRGF